MVREIALDTETTGLFYANGDRIVEIGCVEMIDNIATENMYHVYINPERDVPEEATKIHGLTNEFLADKPVFADIADDFLKFIGSSKLVIHNAKFDMGFLNFELEKAGYEKIPMDMAIDTLEIARETLSGGDSRSLDALCRRFGIDNSARVLHGALLDAQLLSEVYLELRGGREPSFMVAAAAEEKKQRKKNKDKSVRPVREFLPSEEELAQNEFFLDENAKNLKKENPVWDILR